MAIEACQEFAHFFKYRATLVAQVNGAESAKMVFVLWTRSAEDWPKDRGRFRHPEQVLSVPCITRQRLAPPAQLPAFDEAILTSPYAVKTVLANPELAAAVRRVTSHCFGDQTLAALRAHGFSAQQHQCRTLAELVADLPKTGRYLHLGPEEPILHLEQMAPDTFAHLPLYRTQSGVFVPEPQRCHIAAELGRGIVAAAFASPSAVTGFLGEFNGMGITALALGPTTAAACQGAFAKVSKAEENTLASLVALLETSYR